MVVKSSVFRYEFELIHPFADGNGRIGRLWHTRLLAEWNPLFARLPVESIIHNRQRAYYDPINASNNAGTSTVFIEFMLPAIKTALLEASGVKEKTARQKRAERGQPAAVCIGLSQTKPADPQRGPV